MRPGFDQIAQGMGGLMSVTGLPGGGPVRAGIPVADLTAGLFAAQGIMIALLEREVSGQGQWVQSSLLGVDDRDDGFPGGALADGRRRAAAGRQRPPDQHPDRRVRRPPTATSTSPRPATRSSPGYAARWASRS